MGSDPYTPTDYLTIAADLCDSAWRRLLLALH
jgi:hypothetical protein